MLKKDLTETIGSAVFFYCLSVRGWGVALNEGKDANVSSHCIIPAAKWEMLPDSRSKITHESIICFSDTSF